VLDKRYKSYYDYVKSENTMRWRINSIWVIFYKAT